MNMAYVPGAQIVGAPNQQVYAPMGAMTYQPPQTSGLMFAQPPKQTTNNLSAEEYALVTESAGSNFTLTEKERAEAKWNYRNNNGELMLKVIDPQTGLVESAYTHDRFNLVDVPREVVEHATKLVSNIIKTAKVNIGDKMPEQINNDAYIAQAYITKVLPDLYEKSMENYKHTVAQLGNQFSAIGYNGANANMMYGGQFYSMPNYFMSDQTVPMAQQCMVPMVQPYAVPVQQVPVQQVPMGVPTMPVGGTMMGGGNPFVQGGQPQTMMQIQQAPQQSMFPAQFAAAPQQPSVPFPGTPQMNVPAAAPAPTAPAAPAAPSTPNPGIGTVANANV